MKANRVLDHLKRKYMTCRTHTPLLLIYHRLITMEIGSNR